LICIRGVPWGGGRERGVMYDVCMCAVLGRWVGGLGKAPSYSTVHNLSLALDFVMLDRHSLLLSGRLIMVSMYCITVHCRH